MNKEILARIEQGNIIITPTQGLAHHLHSEYAAQQIETGKQSWPSANVLSWNIWLNQLWQEQCLEHDSPPILLTRHQSLLLWSKVIESSNYAKQLLQIDATARQVQAAYRLCKDWNIESIPDEYFINQDVFAFKLWMESYQLRCKAKNWLDQANVITFIEHNFNPSQTKFNKYIFYAFDDLMPRQQSFLTYLRNQNIQIDCLSPSKQNNLTEKIAFEDETKEVDAIADWLIDCSNTQPNAKIGIIVPNLNSKKSLFQTELSKRLSIKQYLHNSVQNQFPFTISLGKALTDYSMINIALTILSLNVFRIDLDRLSLVLRSVFITGYESELNQRHILDAELKKLGQPSIRFETIMHIHERLDEENQCPIMIDKLQQYFSFKQENLNSKSLKEWPSIFSECLKFFLWPGDEKLNSDDYQTWEAWQDCLEKLASLNIISAKYDFYSALNLLNHLCGQIQFQPKTEDKNIFIMGIEGASGMQFDYCWFADAHDNAWPQNTIPNPFLPYELQRELEMPGCTANISLKYAQQLTESLIASTKNILFSYSTNENDNELRPSPLLKNIPFKENNIDLRIGFAEKLYAKRKIEYMETDVAPEIKADQSINGTAALFKDQAACSFKAFARHRLYADSLNHVEIGLNAIDRGILIHRVLQLFWEKIKHSDQLKYLSENVLDRRIKESVNNSLDEQKQFFSDSLGERFIEIERERLSRVLKNWIEIERQREVFTVNAVEKGHHISFHGITLHMRIDRLDQLKDGRLIIIDYKTGEISPNSWFGERPEDPQLPLYAITTEGEVAGLAFAKLKIGDYRYLGISDTDVLIPKIKALPHEQWQQCLKDWQSNLASLALEFQAGKVIVDPMPGACRYCEFPTLCRINERIDAYLEEE